MKKILCLIDTLSFGGGAERQMAGLAGLLHEKGENVTLATYHYHDCDDIIKARYGLRSTLISAKGNFISKLFAVRNYIKKEDFNVVIAYKDGATMIACLCKLLGLRFKLIVSERNTTQTLKKRDRLKFLLYRFADCIVPNSYSQSSYIKEHFSKLSNKVKVITNFTDTKLFYPDVRYQYNTNSTNILVVARINPQKNIERFIEAVKILKERNVPVKIDWFGGVYVGAGPYGDRVGGLYEQANIKDILQFKGDTSKISEVYRQYDAFCLPSLYEGFPNVVCEAMSSGKPVLCSNVCDNPHIVQDGINGFLFDPNDVENIVSIIEKYCNLSIEEKKRMGKSSRTIAIDLLSEESFVNKYINIIERL